MSVPAKTQPEPELDAARGRLSEVIQTMRRLWAGRGVVLAVHTFNGGMRAVAEELTLSGARLAAIVTSAPPEPDDPVAEHLWSATEHGLVMSHREFEAWLLSQPRELTRWLDGLDRDRSWRVLGTTYAQYAELGGRPAYGRWRPEWAVWEDKTRVDELWRRAGVPAPAHVVLAIDDPALADSAARLDQGLGVMLAIDTTRDVLGSSQGLRWVRSGSELASAVTQLRGLTERVRLAPFVRGVPCSVLGMVLSGEVAVFDPIEVITLHRRSSGELVYCGTSTCWRPSAQWPERLREYTRLVGRELADGLGYVGMFSIDGILGERGFVATELNPRHVSGLGLRAGWPEFPTRLLNRAVQESAPEVRGIGWRDVERVFRDIVLRNPSHGLWVPLPAGAVPAGGGDGQVIRVPVPGGTTTVRYRPQWGGVRVLGAVGGTEAHGLALGPFAAALDHAYGTGDLMSFADISVRSTLTAG